MEGGRANAAGVQILHAQGPTPRWLCDVWSPPLSPHVYRKVTLLTNMFHKRVPGNFCGGVCFVFLQTQKQKQNKTKVTAVEVRT